MKTKILLAWLGNTDLKAVELQSDKNIGPIAQAAKQNVFDEIVILSDHNENVSKEYYSWLRKITKSKISIYFFNLTSPTNFSEIYTSVVQVLSEITKSYKDYENTFHLSPGTPAMAAVWVLLSKTKYPAALIESSLEHGVKTVSIPFDIAADFIPSLTIAEDEALVRLAKGMSPLTSEFNSIIFKCGVMKRVVSKTRLMASHDVPVLILGESGTGKELFARAIHSTCARREGPFVAVNCGAIPNELFESEFFGYMKGAFTGAHKDKRGFLEEADKGILFLDEIGELTLNSQVKLLRALQEGVIYKLGTSSPIKIDIRVIGATNRNLFEEVSKGSFRQDLFHRLSLGVIKLPPLREREGDLHLLIDFTLKNINEKFSKNKNWKHKIISAGAKNLMSKHTWPGNIREMINTLSRATIWSAGETITENDIREALFPITSPAGQENESIMGRKIEEGFDLQEVLGDVTRNYLKRALLLTHGNKTEAAKLLGLSNYQTFTNWMKKYDL